MQPLRCRQYVARLHVFVAARTHPGSERAPQTERTLIPGYEGPVLIVDDDPDVRDVMSGVIEAAGYGIVTAANGAEALDRIREEWPALIFLDLEMPVMNGPEFRQHQRHDPELLRIPTIVMTGSQLEPLLDLAIGETLHKPARLADVLALVQRYCVRGGSHR